MDLIRIHGNATEELIRAQGAVKHINGLIEAHAHRTVYGTYFNTTIQHMGIAYKLVEVSCRVDQHTFDKGRDGRVSVDLLLCSVKASPADKRVA